MLTATIEASIEPITASIEMLRSTLATGRIGTVGGTIQSTIRAIAAHVQPLLDAIATAVEPLFDTVSARIRVHRTPGAGLIGRCRAGGEERNQSQCHYSLSHGLLLGIAEIFNAKNAAMPAGVDAAGVMSP